MKSIKLVYFLLVLCMSCFTSGANFESNNILDQLQKLKIELVAPGSICSNEIMQELYQVSDKSNQNFLVPKKCFSSPNELHSGSDEIRFECFKHALYNENSDVIWAIRGGYGAAKIIDKLRTLPKPQKPKIFIGYSDNTALHLFLSQEWGWKTLHGACMYEIFDPKKNISNFQKLITFLNNQNTGLHTTRSLEIKDLYPLNLSASNSHSIVASKMTGGNLTMLQTSIGTHWQVQTQDKILFIEDIHMQPYHVDRTLLHLMQANILHNVKAVIFGNFDNNNPQVISVLKNFAHSLKIPVFKTDRFGHGPINDPIMYNSESKIVKIGTNRYKVIINY